MSWYVYKVFSKHCATAGRSRIRKVPLVSVVNAIKLVKVLSELGF